MDLDLFIEFKTHFTIIHVASVIAGMGSALVSDVFFNFYSKDKRLSTPELTKLNKLSRIVWISLALIIISGIGIFLSDTSQYLSSAKFLLKMTIVGILALNGYALARWVQPHLSHRGFLTSSRERSTRRIAFACGAISIISWALAFILGLANTIPLTYIQAIGLYGLIIAIGIIIALHIEKITFET